MVEGCGDEELWLLKCPIEIYQSGTSPFFEGEVELQMCQIVFDMGNPQIFLGSSIPYPSIPICQYHGYGYRWVGDRVRVRVWVWVFDPWVRVQITS